MQDELLWRAGEGHGADPARSDQGKRCTSSEIRGSGGQTKQQLDLGPAAVEALLAIRPHEAVIDPGASVFGMSAGQISRRIKAATKMAGLGDGFSAHSPKAADGVLSPVIQTWRPRFAKPVF